MSEPSQDTRLPRGALLLVVVGLLACVAAALLTTDKGSGEAADLEWVQRVPVAASEPAAVPGGGGTMELTDGAIRTTGTNVSGYSLFRVSSLLRIDAGAPVGSGRILCSVKAPGRTEIAQSSGSLRATYPRSSVGLYNQEVPEVVLLEFSSHGDELAVLELDGLPGRFTTEKGVKLEWPKYQVGTEHLEYFLPAGQAEAGPRTSLRDDLENDGGTRGQSRLHADHQRRQGDRPDRGRTEEGPPSDRRTARRRKPGKGRRRRTGEGRMRLSRTAARPAAPALSIPLPTLFSFGLAGALSIRPASSGAHIATASSTLRSGRSQAASASALGRIAGIRSWTGATTSFGVVVTIVAL